jgi:hypothetical protein
VLAAQDRLDPGRVPGGHGPEQGRVVGQDGHGLLGPVGAGAEGHHGRAARLLQLGLDLALAGTGDRLPAIGGGNGDRQHHDDDEEQRESGP